MKMLLFKKSQTQSSLKDQIWNLVLSNFAEIETVLYPADVDAFKRQSDQLVDDISSKIKYANEDPNGYSLQHKRWDDEDF